MSFDVNAFKSTVNKCKKSLGINAHILMNIKIFLTSALGCFFK